MNQVMYFAFDGGVNDVDPPISVKEGYLTDALNYEQGVHGGYRRIDGYERFDGTVPQPSAPITDAVYTDADALGRAQQLQQIVEDRRARIASVPGTGPIRGVVYFTDVVIAFRDFSATELRVWWASPGVGWQALHAGLLPGGRFQFVRANFRGQASTIHLYGVDGVNPPFEIDAARAWTDINTGVNTVQPAFVTEHKKHLFLGYPGGSVMHSSLGDPTTWNVTGLATVPGGAGEFATADELTGFVNLPGDVLLIGNRNRTYVLYGAHSQAWELREHSDTTGVIPYSAQRLGDAIYADDRGLVSFQQAETYGDFEDATFSQLVQARYQAAKSSIVASTIVRDKNQYRVFFEDGHALYVTFDNRQIRGIMPVRFDRTVRCVSNDETADGTEIICFGSDADAVDQAYVYRMDVGTSFDGAPIESYIRPVFNHARSPDTRKRFRKIVFDFKTSGPGALKFTPSFSYIDREAAESVTDTLLVHSRNGQWDVSTWDTFTWHGADVPRTSSKIDGTGTNLGMILYSSAAYQPSHTIYGATVHYTPRRMER